MNFTKIKKDELILEYKKLKDLYYTVSSEKDDLNDAYSVLEEELSEANSNLRDIEEYPINDLDFIIELKYIFERLEKNEDVDLSDNEIGLILRKLEKTYNIMK